MLRIPLQFIFFVTGSSDFKFVLGVGLLATPLATVHLCNLVRAAPSLPLIYLLLLHDTLVLAALAG